MWSQLGGLQTPACTTKTPLTTALDAAAEDFFCLPWSTLEAFEAEPSLSGDGPGYDIAERAANDGAERDGSRVGSDYCP